MSASPDLVLKRSLSIAGHRTSVSLEQPFWEALARLARLRGLSVRALVAEIDGARAGANLSSAIRVAVLDAALAGELRDPERDGSTNALPNPSEAARIRGT